MPADTTALATAAESPRPLPCNRTLAPRDRDSIYWSKERWRKPNSQFASIRIGIGWSIWKWLPLSWGAEIASKLSSQCDQRSGSYTKSGVDAATDSPSLHPTPRSACNGKSVRPPPSERPTASLGHQ
jgi:hypothetical protein